MARGEDGLKAVIQSLPKGVGQTHHGIAVDTADGIALADKAAQHIAAYGPVHILINNSGGPPAGPAYLATTEDFLKAFHQHLLANHILMQAVLPGMRASSYGRIINIISTSVKQPIKGLGVSNTIRGAVANWAKTLAGELAPFGITVNNILPGATDTDRMAEIIAGKAAKSGKPEQDVKTDECSHIPAGRFGTPAELAQAIAFLASPAASYINGINLPVDGGRTGCL
jgi:3-oxoacyl-[acyl-carrier protein] reductase